MPGMNAGTLFETKIHGVFETFRNTVQITDLV